MSEEYDNENNYSSFWPLLILIGGLVLWLGYQNFALNSQRSQLSQSVQAALPTVKAAQGWHDRFNAMIQDLIQTGGKNPSVAAIAKEAVQAGVQAGLIQINQQAANGTNGVANPAAPTK